MGEDSESAKNLSSDRHVPSLAEQKKVTPKSPRCDLRGDEQRLGGAQMQTITKQTRNEWIGRKESNIRNFHHLVIAGRNGCSKPAINDVSEPKAVVLDQGVVSK